MISILQLTTSDAVRALLGISEAELQDTVITAAAVEDELRLDLGTWLPTDVVLETVIQEGLAADEWSDEQKTYLRLAAYAKAFCAHYFVANQDNWRLIRLTDGQVDEQRKSSVDLEALARYLQGLMGSHKTAFLALVAPATTTPVSMTVMGKARPTYDPVTG